MTVLMTFKRARNEHESEIESWFYRHQVSTYLVRFIQRQMLHFTDRCCSIIANLISTKLQILAVLKNIFYAKTTTQKVTSGHCVLHSMYGIGADTFCMYLSVILIRSTDIETYLKLRLQPIPPYVCEWKGANYIVYEWKGISTTI